MSEKSKQSSENRRIFLVGFFNKEEGYDEKQVNGFWLVKHWNSQSGKWIVDIYAPDSFENYKAMSKINELIPPIQRDPNFVEQFAHYKHIYGKSFLATQDTNGKFFEVELKQLKKGHKVVPKEKTRKLL